MGWARYLKHSFALPFAFRKVFDATALADIEAATAQAESICPALQVRVVIEHTLPRCYCLRNYSARVRALSLFGKLRIWDTEHNTGVMIYVQWLEGKVELVADRTSYRAVPPEQWQDWTAQIAAACAAGQPVPAICTVLQDLASALKPHLPHTASSARDAVPNSAVVLQ